MTEPPPLRHLDWLGLLLLSWVAPVTLVQVAGGYHYFLSLTFWLIPVTWLARRAMAVAQPDQQAGLPYSRRRRGLAWTTAYVLASGLVLDFVLGRWVLKFDLDRPRQYVYVFPGFGIPIEEVLFYALAPMAIVLVYIWCDEYWIRAYNRRESRLRLVPGQRLVRAAPRVVACGAATLLAGLLYRRPWEHGGWPVYFTFLVVVAFVPTALLLRSVGTYVNWPAMAITTLYSLATAILWEATLAVPNRWWGYNPDHILGPTVRDWSRDPEAWPFPVEAAAVWVCAPLACVLVYEFAKAREYRRGLERGSPHPPAQS